MVTNELINPQSIVVIGASNDITKPGGKVLKNIMDGKFSGQLMAVNPKEETVQGIRSYRDVRDLPEVDLAILAIAAKYSVETVEILASEKSTKAFIILSAGFSEENDEGKKLEKQIVSVVNNHNASLIGPNCIGVLTPQYHGVFTLPIPKLSMKGCDFISGSGATACFIMEAGIPRGLSFARVFSVGNSAQLGVEDLLQFMDEEYVDGVSPQVKLLYIENIGNPAKLLKHASSLILKGCRIAAIKSGTSEAGSRAASSHTGALASSDLAVEALLAKAGIVRCQSREELITVASVMMHPPLKGKRIAVITHAGGPAVMLTDALSQGGLEVPAISGPLAEELKTQLFPGSSVNNPIDFLATGTAEQLGIIIDYADKKFDTIDAMVVIFGTPGLLPLWDVYDVLNTKMKIANKPIFPVLPSTVTAKEEVEAFIDKGRINFPFEAELGKALAKVYYTPKPSGTYPNITPPPGWGEVGRGAEMGGMDGMDGMDGMGGKGKLMIREIIEKCTGGYLAPDDVKILLDAVGIPTAQEAVANTKDEALKRASDLGFPLVMKAVGPVHKSDAGGVVLNVSDIESVKTEFNRLIGIKDATAVLLQPMYSGTELFIGAKKEGHFGHMILCGLGGIFIEVLKDFQAGLSPVSQDEALAMIRKLKGYKIFKGVRGQQPIDEAKFAEIIVKVSTLMEIAPEILEMDINPLLAKGDSFVAVDARVNISKK